jgi:hypothetical protein
MPLRSFRLIKSTPIALAVCEGCKQQFTSRQPLEHHAEDEMRAAFDGHECSLAKPGSMPQSG